MKNKYKTLYKKIYQKPRKDIYNEKIIVNFAEKHDIKTSKVYRHLRDLAKERVAYLKGYEDGLEGNKINW